MGNDSLAPLPADADIDRLLDNAPLAELAGIIQTHAEREAIRHSLERLEDEGRPDGELYSDQLTSTVGEMRGIYQRYLDEHAPVTALQSLRASHLATAQLTATRYRAICAARAAGESWSAIGAALDMSKQGAQDWYNKRSIPLLQDTAPAE